MDDLVFVQDLPKVVHKNKLSELNIVNSLQFNNNNFASKNTGYSNEPTGKGSKIAHTPPPEITQPLQTRNFSDEEDPNYINYSKLRREEKARKMQLEHEEHKRKTAENYRKNQQNASKNEIYSQYNSSQFIETMYGSVLDEIDNEKQNNTNVANNDIAENEKKSVEVSFVPESKEDTNLPPERPPPSPPSPKSFPKDKKHSKSKEKSRKHKKSLSSDSHKDSSQTNSSSDSLKPSKIRTDSKTKNLISSFLKYYSKTSKSLRYFESPSQNRYIGCPPYVQPLMNCQPALNLPYNSSLYYNSSKYPILNNEGNNYSQSKPEELSKINNFNSSASILNSSVSHESKLNAQTQIDNLTKFVENLSNRVLTLERVYLKSMSQSSHSELLRNRQISEMSRSKETLQTTNYCSAHSLNDYGYSNANSIVDNLSISTKYPNRG